jgi:hypothetical protein
VMEREKILQKSNGRTQAWASATVQLSLGWVCLRLRRSRSTLCLLLFSLLVNKAALPLAITKALENLRFFLPPTQSTKFLFKIPCTESTCSTLIFLFNGGTQQRLTGYPDRFPVRNRRSGIPGAPNLTSREPVPGFGTGREDGFSNLVGTEIHPAPLSWLLFNRNQTRGGGPVTNVEHNRNRILVFLKIRFWC